MTVSMLTTRLSHVITGCGGNDTTCSRRSMLARTGRRTARGSAARRQRAVVAAEPLDDECRLLRDDAHRADEHDDDEGRQQDQDDDGDEAVGHGVYLSRAPGRRSAGIVRSGDDDGRGALDR